MRFKTREYSLNKEEDKMTKATKKGNMKKRVLKARAIGVLIFALAFVTELYLYIGMPFTGILGKVLQMVTILIGGLGFAMTVALYPCEKIRKRH